MILLADRWRPGDTPSLLGSSCEECGHTSFPPRPRCARCWSTEVRGVDLPKDGVVYTYTTVHASPHEWLQPPYRLGFIDLEGDGVRVLAHLDGEPRIGARAHLTGLTFGDRSVYGFAIQPSEDGAGA